MPFVEDFDAFFDEHGGFAVACYLSGRAIKAIFEMAWVEITIGRAPFSGEYPTLYGKMSDFDGHFGKTITVDATNYKILDIRPDGSGCCRVVLQAV